MMAFVLVDVEILRADEVLLQILQTLLVAKGNL